MDGIIKRIKNDIWMDYHIETIFIHAKSKFCYITQIHINTDRGLIDVDTTKNK